MLSSHHEQKARAVNVRGAIEGYSYASRLHNNDQGGGAQVTVVNSIYSALYTIHSQSAGCKFQKIKGSQSTAKYYNTNRSVILHLATYETVIHFGQIHSNSLHNIISSGNFTQVE